ncbi:YD repeat-containing protein, partial [Flavobacterium defluvii]
DPKGFITTYTYDSFGRLETVKDNLGNILSENQYNYKP